MADSQPLQKQRSSRPSEVSQVKKYITFALNVLFWLFGVLMILVGLYSKTQKYTASLLGSIPWFLDPANFIIGVGVILFIIPFLGCLGSLRENILFLKIFEYSIAVLCIIQLGIVIYVCVDSERVERVVENFLYKSLPNYRDDPDLQSIVDWTQENMQCCGVRSYDDWEKNLYFKCHEPRVFRNPDACGVPHSCCIKYPSEKNTACGQKLRTSDYYRTRHYYIYTDGCVEATKSYLLEEDRLILLCVVGALVVILQITSMGLAHALVNDIKRQKARWERDAKRQMSREMSRDGADTRLM